jgi:hypothetical protein
MFLFIIEHKRPSKFAVTLSFPASLSWFLYDSWHDLNICGAAPLCSLTYKIHVGTSISPYTRISTELQYI